MSKVYDPWELGSGLGLDHERVTITDMSFGADNTYAVGAMLAMVTWTNEAGDSRIEKYSVGSGFDVRDAGARLVSDGDRDHKVNKQSKWGMFLGKVVELQAHSDIGDPMVAKNWIGTRWDVFRHEYEYVIRGDTHKGQIVLPEHYLGREGDEEKSEPKRRGRPPGSTNKPKPEPVAPFMAEQDGTNDDEHDDDTAVPIGPPAPDPIANAGDSPLSDKLRMQLVLLAGECADEDAFNEAAFDLPDMRGNRAAQKYLLAADGLFAELKAESEE